MELLLGQFLVLVFTLAAWWLARRDLTARAAQAQGPAMADWERLQEAVEALIADLERRAEAAEGRIAEAERRLSRSGPSEPRETEPDASVRLLDEQHEERNAPVYALADAGMTDAAQIARRTGLGQGEVELILRLRTLRSH